MSVADLLNAIPPSLIVVLVGLVVGVESLGVPLPGEIVLVSAAIASSQGLVSPVGVAIAATLGAIIGDSIGYAIGRRGGRPLLTWLSRKAPKHFNDTNIRYVEHMFDRWGVWAVFFGRFIALLRIMAGPLSGVLRMPYPRFLAANVLGGIVWAVGTTTALYFFGLLAEKWLSRFSWLGLIVALVTGAVVLWWVRRKAARHQHRGDDAPDAESGGSFDGFEGAGEASSPGEIRGAGTGGGRLSGAAAPAESGGKF